MNILLSLLKQVAASPDAVTVEMSSPIAAFPGLSEFNFDLKLASGFAFADWMNDEAVSVAEELQVLDISSPNTATKSVACVWRVLLVDGPVVLMNVQLTGKDDPDNFSECHLVGYATIVEAVEAAPFVAEMMKQLSRGEAYKTVAGILKEAARLRQQFEQVFPDGLQRTEALQGLANI